MKTLEIWTDGASTCSHEMKPGGWAYVYVVDNALLTSAYGGELNTTNQRMELLAVIKGLKNVADCEKLDKINYNHIRIITDSAYVFDTMTQKRYINWRFDNWIGSEGQEIKNRDLWEQLINLEKQYKSKNIDVTWRKIRGHKGYLYNEIADKLAVKGKKLILEEGSLT